MASAVSPGGRAEGGASLASRWWSRDVLAVTSAFACSLSTNASTSPAENATTPQAARSLSPSTNAIRSRCLVESKRRVSYPVVADATPWARSPMVVRGCDDSSAQRRQRNSYRRRSKGASAPRVRSGERLSSGWSVRLNRRAKPPGTSTTSRQPQACSNHSWSRARQATTSRNSSRSVAPWSSGRANSTRMASASSRPSSRESVVSATADSPEGQALQEIDPENRDLDVGVRPVHHPRVGLQPRHPAVRGSAQDDLDLPVGRHGAPGAVAPERSEERLSEQPEQLPERIGVEQAECREPEHAVGPQPLAHVLPTRQRGRLLGLATRPHQSRIGDRRRAPSLLERARGAQRGRDEHRRRLQPRGGGRHGLVVLAAQVRVPRRPEAEGRIEQPVRVALAPGAGEPPGQRPKVLGKRRGPAASLPPALEDSEELEDGLAGDV